MLPGLNREHGRARDLHHIREEARRLDKGCPSESDRHTFTVT